jgi:hypothetical protein
MTVPESKYAKNIITEIIPKVAAPWSPKFTPDEIVRMLHIDDSVVKGSFYCETAWTLPAFAKETHGESHQHDYDEILAFFGSNPQDPTNLYAEAEVHIGGEVHTVTKSCLIFLPKNVPHGPIVFKRIDRPIFHFSCGTSQKYF